MDHALLGPEPAQLAVVREVAPDGRRIGEQFVHVAADDEDRQLLDRRATQVVAGADGERHADALVLAVGLEEHVRAGVVGVGVHGIGTGEGARGRRPHVEGPYSGDPRHGGTVSSGPRRAP